MPFLWMLGLDCGACPGLLSTIHIQYSQVQYRTICIHHTNKDCPAFLPWYVYIQVCDICGTSALFDVTGCETCNTVAHRLCVGYVTSYLEEARIYAISLV